MLLARRPWTRGAFPTFSISFAILHLPGWARGVQGGMDKEAGAESLPGGVGPCSGLRNARRDGRTFRDLGKLSVIFRIGKSFSREKSFLESSRWGPLHYRLNQLNSWAFGMAWVGFDLCEKNWCFVKSVLSCWKVFGTRETFWRWWIWVNRLWVGE